MTDWLISWSRILEKFLIPELVNWSVSTMFTEPATDGFPVSVLSFHLYLFLSDFWPVCANFFPSHYRLFYIHLSTLDFITVTVFGESISCKALHYVIFCPSVTTFLVLQIFCSVLYSQILSVCQWNKLSVCVFPLGKGATRTFYVWMGSQKNYLQT